VVSRTSRRAQRRELTMGRGRAAGRGPWIAVAGARPNYVKLAPLVRAAKAQRRDLVWIDTGQHTSAALTTSMIRDLGLPAPAERLRAPRAGTGRIPRLAARLAPVLAARRPSLVVVLGDVDSTLAAALAAWRQDLPLVHIEAGLRAFQRGMPEERNRILVDGLSDRLYLSEPMAEEHLRREGCARGRIRKPGNVMADALEQHRAGILKAAAGQARRRGSYVVATLHRQANVDVPGRLAGYVEALARVAREHPVVFPVHPRTRQRLRAAGRDPRHLAAGLTAIRPLGYLGFLGLVAGSAGVITDSGGLQVEAALLGVPCVTARRRTEHRLTLTHGGNVLAGTDPRRLPAAVRHALSQAPIARRRPRAWDGHAAERIVADWCRGFARPRRLPGPTARALAALQAS